MSSLADLKGELDLKRKLYILAGGIADFTNECVVVPDEGFDIERSIFSVMDEPIKQMIKHAAKKPMWSDSAIGRVSRDFEQQIPRPVPESTDLLDFMRDECDFKIEHADGSFMDHLTFCRDYGAAHYKSQSPTPLFVHSILGVGTNIFPMERSKIPQLRRLVSPADFKQIEAFPSILRIVNSCALIDELAQVLERKNKLSGLSFYRLIDNEPLHLTTEELWVQLNYQLIHLMDFLPVANWSQDMGNGQFQVFARLFDLMTMAGRMEAKVAWHVNDGDFSLKDLVAGEHERYAAARQMLKGFQHERSAKIGHNLDFTLELASNL